MTLFVKIDLVLKPDPYVGPDILSVQTLDTLYHIPSCPSQEQGHGTSCWNDLSSFPFWLPLSPFPCNSPFTFTAAWTQKDRAASLISRKKYMTNQQLWRCMVITILLKKILIFELWCKYLSSQLKLKFVQDGILNPNQIIFSVGRTFQVNQSSIHVLF